VKTRILIVDDEPDLLEVLSEYLTEEGYEVSVAASAAEFCELAAKSRPHLIILDIALGDKNGPDTYRELLRRGVLDRNIAVLFLTGLVQESWGQTPVTNGRLTALHPKPFDYDDLLRDIRSLIRNASASASGAVSL
jgi:DNA-binding response OmpR family regulator